MQVHAHKHIIFNIETIFKQFLTLIIHLFYVKQMHVFGVGLVFQSYIVNVPFN